MQRLLTQFFYFLRYLLLFIAPVEETGLLHVTRLELFPFQSFTSGFKRRFLVLFLGTFIQEKFISYLEHE